MYKYFIKRLFLLIPTVFGIIFITFLLIQAIPGDPVNGLVGERTNPETIIRIKKELGADRPFLLQYIGFLKLLAHGELGRSYYTNREVFRDIAEKLPNTIKLAFGAIIFSVTVGVLLGVLMAVKQGTLWDRFGLIFSACGLSLPVFWFGLLLIFVFAFLFDLLPPSGMGGGDIRFLILPAITLGINSAAYLSRITRSCLLEIMNQPYITAARAKGLKKSSIIFKHSFKNSLIPIITLVGIDFGSYLNGAVLTETVFGWDGMGRYAVEGIFKRDYPVIMGSVLVGALLFLLVNLFTDLLYSIVDPKIRYRTR